VCVVGERGQITLPKIIRDLKGVKAKEKVIVKVENGLIVVEKMHSKKEKEKLMAEGYRKTAKLSLELAEEMDSSSSEAWGLLDDY
jgi:bifunctional DNA-binding transcriptional regulator/antitoxin component of YhaV-PrlF toxin-antitoxin module